MLLIINSYHCRCVSVSRGPDLDNIRTITGSKMDIVQLAVLVTFALISYFINMQYILYIQIGVRAVVIFHTLKVRVVFCVLQKK